MLMKNKGGQIGMDYLLAIAIGVFIVVSVAIFLFRAEISETLSGLFSDFEKEKKAGSVGTRVGSAEEKIREIENALSSDNLGLAEMRYGEYIGEYFNEAEFGSLEEQAKLSPEKMIEMKNEYLKKKLKTEDYNLIISKFRVVPVSNGKYEIHRIGEAGEGSGNGGSRETQEAGKKTWADIEKQDSRRVIFSLDADKTLMFFEWKTGKGRAVVNINGKGYEEVTEEVKSSLINRIDSKKSNAIGEAIDRVYRSRDNLKKFVGDIPNMAQFGTIGILNEEGSFQSAEKIIGEGRCTFVSSLDRNCRPQDIFVLMYPREMYPEN